jgi:hypothetical protein
VRPNNHMVIRILPGAFTVALRIAQPFNAGSTEQFDFQS